MSPRIKVYLGILLVLPLGAAILIQTLVQFSHPDWTETRMFLQTGWLSVTLIPAAAGVMLISAGMDEDSDPDL